MPWIYIGRYKHKIHDSEEVELMPFRVAVIEGVRLKKVGALFDHLAAFFKRFHHSLSIIKCRGLTVDEFEPLVTQVLSGRSDLVPETFYKDYLDDSVQNKVRQMCIDINYRFTDPDEEGWEAAKEALTADQARVASLPEMKLVEPGTTRHVGQTKTKPAVAVAQGQGQAQVHHQLFIDVPQQQAAPVAVAVPHAQVQSQVHH